MATFPAVLFARMYVANSCRLCRECIPDRILSMIKLVIDCTYRTVRVELIVQYIPALRNAGNPVRIHLSSTSPADNVEKVKTTNLHSNKYS